MSSPESKESVPKSTVVQPKSDQPKSVWQRIKGLGRWLLLAFGLGAVVWLVRDAGPAEVWAVLRSAGVWLPLILFCEIGFVGMDVIGLRQLLGPKAASVPLSVWLRSALMAYGVMVLLPAGRAGGEVMRAAALTPHVGGPRAAAGATLLQGVTLLGNTLISIPCYAAVAIASGPFSNLALLVAGNGLVTGVLGSVVLFGARFSSVGGFLGRRISALASHGAHFDASLKEMPTIPTRSIAAALIGRLFQTVQYGTILVAVGGGLVIGGTFIAQAIHLVGAGLGDMVPNQAGITESAYRIFASDLGMTSASAQVIAIPLLHRFCQFLLAGISLILGAVWKPREEGSSEPRVSVGARVCADGHPESAP